MRNLILLHLLTDKVDLALHLSLLVFLRSEDSKLKTQLVIIVLDVVRGRIKFLHALNHIVDLQGARGFGGVFATSLNEVVHSSRHDIRAVLFDLLVGFIVEGFALLLEVCEGLLCAQHLFGKVNAQLTIDEHLIFGAKIVLSCGAHVVVE